MRLELQANHEHEQDNADLADEMQDVEGRLRKDRGEPAWRGAPSSDGPSAMPAAISPMTDGCPSRRAAAPKTRAATTMIRIWSRRSGSGDTRERISPASRRAPPLGYSSAPCNPARRAGATP
jgi:hypothetical protein